MGEETVSKNFIEQEIDKDLKEGVYQEVCTRFPPEPNGYLHIGHAKSIILNSGLAKEYGGTFHLRFDDTNPMKEDMEFVESIKEDVKWLGADWGDHLYFASDYFDTMYECAIKLIKKGKAYVCDLSAEEIREYRGTLTEPGKNSPYRDRSVEENLQLFEEMRAGKIEDGKRVLRAKIDMTSPNINMRDPVIYRVAHMTHHNTGDKWCIYPMYDFAHPVEDAIEGADVIDILRIQLERQQKGLFPSAREYARIFGINEKRLALAKPDVTVLHPGPMNRGLEISWDVGYCDNAKIRDEVQNGVAVRMALLFLTLTGGKQIENIN
mgnify:CR=1 FL=1